MFGLKGESATDNLYNLGYFLHTFLAKLRICSEKGTAELVQKV